MSESGGPSEGGGRGDQGQGKGSILARAKEVFLAVRGLAQPARDDAVLRMCGTDAALKRAVEGLLAGDKAPLPFESLADDIVAARDAMAGESADAEADAGAGSRIGPYRVLERIGEGGFGVVYLAEQEEPVRRRVALKILKLGMDTKQIVARFEAERQALAIMDHPGIAKVHDAGATPSGRPYFVMELCPGQSITQFCDSRRVPLRERLALFGQVCLAVQHAHQKGLIHRDIKPSNILVSEVDGKPLAKVIDFGIAKALEPGEAARKYFTEHRQLLGTPEYMSPEHAEGSLDIDTRADVYSLGVLLYELLTGSTPFSSRELRSAAYAEIQRIIREVEPPRPSTRLALESETIASVAASRAIEPKRLGVMVRGELDWIVMKALEKDRRRRYSSAAEFAADVDRFLTDEPVTARPASAAYRWKKFAKRNKVVVGAIGGIVVSLAAGLVVSTSMYYKADHQRVAADSARRDAERTSNRFRAINRFLIVDLLTAPNPWEGGKRTTTVAEVLDKSSVRVSSRFASQPELAASVMHTLGESYHALGMYAEAQEQYDGSLAIRSMAKDTPDDELVDSLRARADNLCSLGKFDDAAKACNDAMTRAKQSAGPRSMAVASILASMADIQIGQSKYTEAENSLRDSLDILNGVPAGERDMSAIAKATNTLGSSLHFQGNYAEAERQKLAALEMFKSTYGEKSPYVAQVQNDLGTVCSLMQRFEDSERYYQLALPVLTTELGPDHSIVLICKRSLANTMSFLDKNEDAERMLKEVIAAGDRTLGEAHPESMGSANSLATLYLRTNRASDALPLLRRLYEQSRKSLGETHSETLKYSSNLAWCELKVGNIAEAETAFRRAIEGFEATQGRKHPDTIAATDGYAQFLGYQKRWVEAAKYDLQVVDEMVDAGRPEDLNMARILSRAGSNLIQAKDYAGAKAPLNRSLDLCRRLMKPNDWRTGVSEGRLGECMSFLGEREEAEKLLVKSLETTRSDPEAPKGQDVVCLKRLVAHFERMGQPEKAADFKRQLPAEEEKK